MRWTYGLIFVLFLASTAAFAQDAYKCKVNGTLVIQDSPCKVAGPAKPVAQTSVQPATTAAAVPPVSQGATAAQAELERQKAFIAKGAKARHILDLKYEIERTEANMDSLRAAMGDELGLLERKKQGANNNLAGATYLNSLATERQAVTSRYEVDINGQRDRLKQLREDLARAQGS